MPKDERIRMLKVRNASPIRMFQSYDNLEEEVKMALNNRETFDLEMTKRIASLQQEINALETSKMSIFQRIIEANGANAVESFRETRQAILLSNCN